MEACPWPIDIESCLEGTGLDPESPEDAMKIASVVGQASTMLSRWSGYRIGGCNTVRPLEPCGECRLGCCGSDCITLHSASAVMEVRVFGEVVDPLQYHFDAARGSLCAVGSYSWPLSDPRAEAVGSLEVDVMVGEAPDAWALSVAQELACELLRSAVGKDCRLPRNATTVSSQGVTVTLSQDEVMLALPSIISWVNAVNPVRASAPARILSPEVSGRRRSASFFAPWR